MNKKLMEILRELICRENGMPYGTPMDDAEECNLTQAHDQIIGLLPSKEEIREELYKAGLGKSSIDDIETTNQLAKAMHDLMLKNKER